MSIVVSELSYIVDGASLLQDISVEMPQGSIVAIVGPNGSGKTSLLKVLNGESTASGGNVFIDDADISSLSFHCLLRMNPLLTPVPMLISNWVFND